LNINQNAYPNLKKIQISTINGEIVYHKVYQSSPGNILFSYPPGTYLLTALDAYGNSFTQKIIKH